LAKLDPFKTKEGRAVTAEVRALERADLRQLRAEWRKRYGQPPKIRSPELFARLLAWRIQAPVFGGLDEATIRILRGERPHPPLLCPKAGDKLVREYRGKRHEVIVLGGAFEYEGREYGSLSEIARAITGTRWNGPRFFGLRDGQ
jgi:hypothetical protein